MNRLDPRLDAWRRRMLAGVEDVPLLGSPEWWLLPEGDRRWVASVVVAGCCWVEETAETENRVRRELTALQRAYKAGEDADYVARIADHQHRWTGRGFRRDRWKEQQIEDEYLRWVGGASA